VAVVHNPGVDRAGGERGATAVAYAVMVAILALLLVGGIMVLSGSIGTTLSDTGNCVADLSDCGGGGTGSGGSGGGGGGGSTTTTRAGTTTTTTTGP
jgi:Flp pilus assembly pilin Flp